MSGPDIISSPFLARKGERGMVESVIKRSLYPAFDGHEPAWLWYIIDTILSREITVEGVE